MATNKTFQEEEKKKEAVKPHTVWVCPGCGKTVHADRQYCGCHTDLSGARARLSKTPAEIDRRNFETSRVSCDDCPEYCAWCASFGDLTTNKRGFGGEGCQHNNGRARCYCCQGQVKLGLRIGEGRISAIMGNITAKNLRTMAEVIQEEMEKPVLARIRHDREQTAAFEREKEVAYAD
jgi:hypothetical protein